MATLRLAIAAAACATAWVPPRLAHRRPPARPSSLAPTEAAPRDAAEWATLVQALEAYKTVHGDVRVPTRFAVPDDDAAYPEACRGLKLGQRVASIRATGRYVDDESRRRQLEAIGFEWRLRRPSAAQRGVDPPEPFDVVLSALEAYRSNVDDGAVPHNFVVPRNDDWPAACRGLPLGARLEALRDPDHAYFDAATPTVAAEREKKLAALGVAVARGAGDRQSTARRFEIVFEALECYKRINGNLNVMQTFVVPDEDPWPVDSRSMKLGSRVNAMRSHGTFLRRHPERRQRLVELGLPLNDPEPPPQPAGPGSIIDAVLGNQEPARDGGWAGLDFGEEAAGPEEPERPRVAPVGADFYDESILAAEDFDRFVEEGWRFDNFDGGYDFDDVVEALAEYKRRHGTADVPEDFVVPDDDDEEEEGEGPADIEDLDVALAAFLASSKADAEDATLLGDAAAPFPELAGPDDEPTLAELEALEAEGGPAAAADAEAAAEDGDPALAAWPERTRGLGLGRACEALRVGDAPGREDPAAKARLDELGFDWGDPAAYIENLRWHEFLGCLFSFSKIKGSLNVAWDFVVPAEDPWPAPFWGAPLGRWANEVRRQEPTFARHFPERRRHLRLMGFQWLPAVFEAPPAVVDERLPPCLRLAPEDLEAPFRKRKRRAAPKKTGPKKPPPLPTRGDVDVDYSAYTVKVLKDLLRERELPVSGKRKADYVERLAADDLARQAAAAPSAEDDDDDLDEDDDDLDDDDDDDEDDLDEDEDELDVVDALSEALVSAPDDEMTSPDDEL